MQTLSLYEKPFNSPFIDCSLLSKPYPAPELETALVLSSMKIHMLQYLYV